MTKYDPDLIDLPNGDQMSVNGEYMFPNKNTKPEFRPIYEKYNYSYTNTIMWILAAIAVVLLLGAFQSSEEDKAKCLNNSNQSAETCEFYIR